MTEYSGWWKCLRKLSTLNYRPGDPGWTDMQAWLLWHPWNRSGSTAWIKSLHKKNYIQKVISFEAALTRKIYALFNTVCFNYTHYPPQKTMHEWDTRIDERTFQQQLPACLFATHLCIVAYTNHSQPPLQNRLLPTHFQGHGETSYGWDTKPFGVWEGQTCMLLYSHRKSSSFGQ